MYAHSVSKNESSSANTVISTVTGNESVRSVETRPPAITVSPAGNDVKVRRLGCDRSTAGIQHVEGHLGENKSSSELFVTSTPTDALVSPSESYVTKPLRPTDVSSPSTDAPDSSATASRLLSDSLRLLSDSLRLLSDSLRLLSDSLRRFRFVF